MRRSPGPHRTGTGPFQSTHPVWGATSFARIFSSGTGHFNPRTPCGVRPWTLDLAANTVKISIHAPRVGCDVEVDLQHIVIPGISIHAPRVGCDDNGRHVIPVYSYFNPRTPCGVRQYIGKGMDGDAEFQSTHPVWGATVDLLHRCGDLERISIHAPRVGCDRSPATPLTPMRYFNPRTPCGVRRTRSRSRGSTSRNFNPRTPCGVRLMRPDSGTTLSTFQSTHPVWGATTSSSSTATSYLVFQSTHPVWGATAQDPPGDHRPHISIHAPRVGCDSSFLVLGCWFMHFNPRTPCGVRLHALRLHRGGLRISIHAPRVGCDADPRPRWTGRSYFNPRTPCGVRPAVRRAAIVAEVISIHAPRVGCDDHAPAAGQVDRNFNPRTPCGVRRFAAADWPCPGGFQSTHPVWGATACNSRL